MDWSNFDFSKDDAFNSANDPIAQEALDVDTFFKKLDGSTENEDVEIGIEEEVIHIQKKKILILVCNFIVLLSFFLIA